jgi:hypothetical protein
MIRENQKSTANQINQSITNGSLGKLRKMTEIFCSILPAVS